MFKPVLGANCPHVPLAPGHLAAWLAANPLSEAQAAALQAALFAKGVDVRLSNAASLLDLAVTTGYAGECGRCRLSAGALVRAPAELAGRRPPSTCPYQSPCTPAAAALERFVRRFYGRLSVTAEQATTGRRREQLQRTYLRRRAAADSKLDAAQAAAEQKRRDAVAAAREKRDQAYAAAQQKREQAIVAAQEACRRAERAVVEAFNIAKEAAERKRAAAVASAKRKRDRAVADAGRKRDGHKAFLCSPAP